MIKENIQSGKSLLIFKDLGLKATGPRLKILDLFIKNADSGKKRHMSAEGGLPYSRSRR